MQADIFENSLGFVAFRSAAPLFCLCFSFVVGIVLQLTAPAKLCLDVFARGNDVDVRVERSTVVSFAFVPRVTKLPGINNQRQTRTVINQISYAEHLKFASERDVPRFCSRLPVSSN